MVTSTAQSTGYPASAWWPTISANPQLSGIFSTAQNVGDGIFAVLAVILLVRRLLETKGLDRIVIAPIIAAGLAAVFAVTATTVAQLFSDIAVGPTGAFVAESLVDVLLPVAFLVAVIQRALLARNLAGLSARVSAGADLGRVRYALRETLHDPTLEVLDVSAPPGAPRPALPSARADSRLVEVIRTDAGAPIAVVIADAALERYRGLFDAAVRTSGLALRNAQLQAEAARAELDNVRASRARIVAAALAERRRLERDLHDGAQQHLLGLAARLTAAMSQTEDPGATAAFAGARAELGLVLAELRDLAHGIHPASLVQGGLAPALEEVAERLPLAIHLDVAAGPGAARGRGRRLLRRVRGAHQRGQARACQPGQRDRARDRVASGDGDRRRRGRRCGSGGPRAGQHDRPDQRGRRRGRDRQPVRPRHPDRREDSVRIAIADDSALFRSGLVLLLEASGARVTTQASSGEELIASLFPARPDRPARPDAVILDLRMPPTYTGEGIQAAAEIRARDAGIGILVLSTFAEASYASQLMEAVGYGVGYLLKDNVTDAGHLISQLERIVAGETVLDATVVRRLLARKRSAGRMDTLNPREREVLARMAEGRSNVGIAKDLHLSPRTVEAHVTSVFGKLGLDQTDTDNNRIRAVLAYLRLASDQEGPRRL